MDIGLLKLINEITHPMDSNYKIDSDSVESNLDNDHAVRYDGNMIGSVRKQTESREIDHPLYPADDNYYKAQHDASGDVHTLDSADEALDWLKDRHEFFTKWNH